jgi:hypothetical protein
MIVPTIKVNYVYWWYDWNLVYVKFLTNVIQHTSEAC